MFQKVGSEEAGTEDYFSKKSVICEGRKCSNFKPWYDQETFWFVQGQRRWSIPWSGLRSHGQRPKKIQRLKGLMDGGQLCWATSHSCFLTLAHTAKTFKVQRTIRPQVRLTQHTSYGFGTHSKPFCKCIQLPSAQYGPCFRLLRWFSTSAEFCSPTPHPDRGHWAMLFHREGGATCISWVKSAAKDPTMHRTASHSNEVREIKCHWSTKNTSFYHLVVLCEFCHNA